MNINNLKLFVTVKDIIIPPKVNNKHLSIIVLSENNTFINTINEMNFSKKIIKTVYVPTTIPPVKTFLDFKYKQELINNDLRPVRGEMKEFDYIQNKHFYVDMNNYYDTAIKRFNIDNFKIAKVNNIFNSYISYYNRYVD